MSKVDVKPSIYGSQKIAVLREAPESQIILGYREGVKYALKNLLGAGEPGFANLQLTVIAIHNLSHLLLEKTEAITAQFEQGDEATLSVMALLYLTKHLLPKKLDHPEIDVVNTHLNVDKRDDILTMNWSGRKRKSVIALSAVLESIRVGDLSLADEDGLVGHVAVLQQIIKESLDNNEYSPPDLNKWRLLQPGLLAYA